MKPTTLIFNNGNSIYYFNGSFSCYSSNGIFYLNKGIDGWDKNDSDKEKIKRTSNRSI